MIDRVGTWTKNVESIFSIAILLSTLFAPWRRLVTHGGKALDDQVKAMLDTLVSRFVGFTVRFFALIAALIMTSFTFAAGAVLALAWPVLPIAATYLILKGTIL